MPWQWIDEIDAGRYPGWYLTPLPARRRDGPQGVQRLAPLASFSGCMWILVRIGDLITPVLCRSASPFDHGALLSARRVGGPHRRRARKHEQRLRSVDARLPGDTLAPSRGGRTLAERWGWHLVCS